MFKGKTKINEEIACSRAKEIESDGAIEMKTTTWPKSTIKKFFQIAYMAQVNRLCGCKK